MMRHNVTKRTICGVAGLLMAGAAFAVDVEPVEDLEVHSVLGTAAGDAVMNMGTPYSNGTGVVLMKWDETDPSFSNLTAATLGVTTLETLPWDEDGSFTVHQMLTPWDEGTDFGTSLPVAGVDYNPHPHAVVGWASNHTDMPGGDLTDISALIKAWVTGAIPNHGLILVPEGQQNANFPLFLSNPGDDSAGGSPAYDPENTIPSVHHTVGLGAKDTRISTVTAGTQADGILEAMADSHVDEFFPAWQYKGNAQPNIGVFSDSTRAYVLYKWGLGEVTQSDPAGSWDLTQADFELHTVTAGNASQGFGVHRMLVPWTESGVHWAQFGAGGPQPGADYEATPLGIATVGSGVKSDTIDILDVANVWLDNPDQNYGLIVVPTNGTPPNSIHWFSTSERGRGYLDVDDTRLIFAAEKLAGPFEFTSIEVGDVLALSFESQEGFEYDLQYAPVAGGGYVSTGMKALGNGGTQLLFDVSGLDTGLTYRIAGLPAGEGGGSTTNPPPASGAAFVDMTSALFPGSPLLSNTTAGWGDMNNDGYPDLADGLRVWKNNGGTSFSEIVSPPPGRIFADIDNDGFLDLYGYQNNSPTIMDVYSNVSGNAFLPVGFPVLDARNDNRGTCWGDWDEDGDPDLYVAAFEFNLTPPHTAMNWPDEIVLNSSNGTSFAVGWTEPPTPLRSRGVTACDFDQDGDQDIFVCHYRLQSNNLMIGDGTGNFVNMASTFGADGFQAGHPVAPFAHTIGAAWGDFDNDGDFDLMVGNFAHPAGWNGIPANQPESQFLENTGAAGSYHFVERTATVGLHYQESYAGPALADYDNDGDLDFYLGVALTTGSFSIDQDPVLYQNQGNWIFTDVTADAGLKDPGGVDLGISYQAAWADIDDDGDLDLVTNGKMFVNQGNSNHWLKVKVDGINQANVGRDAIGTQVKIDLGGGNTLVRQVESGTGEHCSNDLTLHFGLGSEAGPVDLEITWLNGVTQTNTSVAVDQTVVVQ